MTGQDVCMYVCMYVRTYVCMHACMHVCMHACMYMCMCHYYQNQMCFVCSPCGASVYCPKQSWLPMVCTYASHYWPGECYSQNTLHPCPGPLPCTTPPHSYPTPLALQAPSPGSSLISGGWCGRRNHPPSSW